MLKTLHQFMIVYRNHVGNIFIEIHTMYQRYGIPSQEDGLLDWLKSSPAFTPEQDQIIGVYFVMSNSQVQMVWHVGEALDTLGNYSTLGTINVTCSRCGGKQRGVREINDRCLNCGKIDQVTENWKELGDYIED